MKGYTTTGVVFFMWFFFYYGGDNLVTINGQKYQLADGIKVSEYLETEGIDKGTIAIELNGEILPKSRYEETVLSDGDKIEIVNFVGGG